MSHFTVLVIGDNFEEQLAPFQENNMEDCPQEYVEFCDETDYVIKKWEDHKDKYPDIDEFVEEYYGYKKENGRYGYWENPNAKWDWYQVGGRWCGFFKMKENGVGEIGEKSLLDDRHYCDIDPENIKSDIILKKHVDFEGMMKDAYDQAYEKYSIMERFFDDGVIPTLELKWEDVLKKEDLNINQKRELYNNQTPLLVWENIRKKYYGVKDTLLTSDKRDLIVWGKLEDFQCTKEEYCQNAANSSFVTFAFIKDGKWYEKGEMGWRGIVTNETDQNEWNKQFTEMILNLPDDTMLTIVDCHI